MGSDFGMYAEFSGTYSNRIDSKGRVSIPFSFREQIKPLPETGGDELIYCHRSLTNEYILEAGGPEHKKQLRQQLQKNADNDPYSEEYEALSYALFAQSTNLSMDKEGRIVVNAFIIEILGKTQEITFVGMGLSFQIWSQSLYQEKKDALYKRASQARACLGKKPSEKRR